MHDKHYVRIKHVRTGQTLVDKFNFTFISQVAQLPLLGDLLIEVFEEGWASDKRVIRVNYNSFFIHPSTDLSVKALSKDPIGLVLQGNKIKVSKSVANKNFSITLFFEYFCLCHLQDTLELEC
jgi:hypothetical protein